MYHPLFGYIMYEINSISLVILSLNTRKHILYVSASDAGESWELFNPRVFIFRDSRVKISRDYFIQNSVFCIQVPYTSLIVTIE